MRYKLLTNMDIVGCKSGEGLSLSEFVWLMQCTIPHEPHQKSQLYDGLIRLFTDIDINGDKSLEWSEFTQYITDAVITQKKFNLIDDEEANQNLYEDENEPDAIKIEKAFSKSVKSYALQPLNTSKWPENTDNVVKIISSIRNDSRYFILFRNDNKICLFESKEFACVQQIKSPPQHQLNGSMFLDFDISEKEQVLAVVNSDKKIFFWAFTNYKVPLLVGEIDILMKSIYRLESVGLWATSASNPAIVRLWKFQSGKLSEESLTISHTQEITALRMMCSTSIDGKLRIWNPKTNALVFDSGSPAFLKTYKLGDVLNTVHNIIGADYVPNHKGYIVTWQFTSEVTIWNPQYSIHNPYIGKYLSHLSPVTSCRLLKTSTFCVSVDKRMILRVWDVRTLTTSQVLSLGANFDTKPYLHVLPDDNLVLFGKHPRKLANQNFALRKMHTVCAMGVAFNEYHKKFIVATPIDVRLYDCETGKLNEIFVDLVEAGRTIKCFEQGARHRMFYLGDSAGDVNMFNTKNGPP